MQKKITKSLIDATAPGTSDTFLWDTEVRGFGVRIQPSGSKTFMVRYRTQDGTQRKQKLGRTSDITPDKARDLARKVFTAVAEGKDPLAERRAELNTPLITDLAERFMKEHSRPFKKPNSQRNDEKNWTLYVVPALGERRVKDITKADILALHGSLSDKRASANQVLALLSKAMNLAEDWGWRPALSNPCHRVRRYALKKHDTVLTAAQIGRLHVTMNKMVEERRLTHEFASFIRLLQLTGCRKNEILAAESAWVDLEAGMLKLPDSKVGPRNIPLSETAKAIITTLSGKNLITGDRTMPQANVYRVWKRIKAEAELPAELRLHDLRHTAGSLSHKAGMTQKQIADLLGHSILATTDKYIHGQMGDAALTANALGSVIEAQWAKATQPAAA